MDRSCGGSQYCVNHILSGMTFVQYFDPTVFPCRIMLIQSKSLSWCSLPIQEGCCPIDIARHWFKYSHLLDDLLT